MLSWLVQGFERMVPQPEMLKKLEVSTARLGETKRLPGRGDSGAGSPSLSSCTPQLGPWGGKPQGKFSRVKERPQGAIPALPSLAARSEDPSFGTHWCQQCWGLGLMVLVNEMGPKPQWRMCGAVHVGPLGVGDVPTQGGVGPQTVLCHVHPSLCPSAAGDEGAEVRSRSGR